MSIFNLFKKKYGTGALVDPRPYEEKIKDYQAEEVAAFAPVPWREKPQSEWRKFPIFDQDGSSSCVAQSTAKSLGINNFLEEKEFAHLSARDIYARRKNKPSGGMWGQDACEIARSYGATLNALMNGQQLGESEMNRDDDRKPSHEVIGKVYRAANWFALPFDIERIASIVAEGKPAMLFFRFDYGEWDREAPIIQPASQKSAHHAITGVDFTLYQGKKAIIIDDSWGQNRGINGQRVVTEEWFNPTFGRITWASYFDDLSNLALLNPQITEKPKYRFTRELTVGSRGHDVAQLQRCLGYLKDAEGYLFPLSQEPTGYYGGITRRAVLRYQAMKGLPQTGSVNQQTLAALNQDFA